MGQNQTTPSLPNLTKTQILFTSLSRTLPPLALQDYNNIFTSLAEADGETPFWKEDTLARFLEVPAKIGSLLFKSVGYLAALPTLEGVPAVLDKEGLGVAVTVLTGQVPRDVLTEREVGRLIFNSFAESPTKHTGDDEEKVDDGKVDGKDDGRDDGSSKPASYGPQISVTTMQELILFLLSITTSASIATPSQTLATATPTNCAASHKIAKSIISSMQAYAKTPSQQIHYDAFRAICERDAPYLLDPLAPLFQKFLYDQHKWGGEMVREDWVGGLEVVETSELMSLATLAQISMFLPKERRMGRMVSLYAGSRDGFSMGMFESKVLKYPGTSPPNLLMQGPSILLMRGTTVGAYTHLPGTHQDNEVIFGAYMSTPWKSSTKGTPYPTKPSNT
jgi:hypothetical protein